jgi:hypothetical protein
MLSDGASRLVDPFQLATWEDLLALLDESGPDELRAALVVGASFSHHVRVEGSGRTVLACPTPSRKHSTNQPGT